VGPRPSALATESPAAARRAPDALAPPPGNPRFPLFDGLRAIAALSIVVTHCSGLTGFNTGNPLGAWTARMDLGVALFFVISGFLLYRPFLAARFEGRPAPRVGAYARRRLLRIVPAYWAALTILAATVHLTGVFGPHWWAYYGFLQIYSNDWILGGIGPAWSLCVEMSFYAALPLVASLMARAQRGRPRAQMVRIEVAFLAAISLLSLVVRTVAHAHGHSVLPNTLPGNLDWFAAGMGLALASVVLRGREHEAKLVRTIHDRAWVPWLGAGAIFALLGSPLLDMPRGFPWVFSGGQWLAEHVLYIAVGLLLALPAVFGEPGRGPIRRLLGHPVLAWLGLVSYGIFLWHASLLIEVFHHGAGGLIPHFPFVSSLLVTTAAAIGCAAVSYYVLERPLLRFKDPRPRRPAPGSGAPAEAERVELARTG
jgi:peptidoglycan/LPS O-acetylase OafA/YrhL